MTNLPPEFLDKWAAEVLCGWHLGPKAMQSYRDNTDKFIMWKSDWHPTSDQAPAWQIQMVIGAIMKKGWSWDIKILEPENRIFIEMWKFGERFKIIGRAKAEHEDILIAIVLAAYRAIEGKNL